MINAAYMALVVMAWAATIGVAGSIIAFAIIIVALEIYEEYFKHR